MKDIKNIIAETPNAFLWGDGETVDITIDDEDDKTFIQILIDYKCLVCDNRIVMDNEKMFREITDNIKGMELKCKSCDQKWFIHKKINLF